MKALIQRVRGRTAITVEEPRNFTHSPTEFFDGVGLVVLLAWVEKDLDAPNLEVIEDWILSRILGLRIFEDAQGRMNLNLADYAKENKLASGILWVSQFTLAAELDSGFRPSFKRAMNPLSAKIYYDRFCSKVKENSPHQNLFGVFGANMDLSFTNWGPVSIMLDKETP